MTFLLQLVRLLEKTLRLFFLTLHDMNSMHTTSALYFVGGDLYLPDPVGHLTGEALAWARYVEPTLRLMHKRDMGNIEKRIVSLSSTFANFKDSEVCTWKNITGREVQSSHLVIPSGSLRSKIAHHAHQPTFFTRYPVDGETADPTNPCIAMLMGNAFQPGHSLIFDHISRREEKSEALQKYPDPILRCHETFVQDIRESMEAKIEVVYGLHVKDRMVQSQGFHFDMLPLWGQFQGVKLILDRESNYANGDLTYPYRRILLFVAHPQRFLYNQNLAESRLQDLNLIVASKIAQMPCMDHYYEEQKWRLYVPRNFQNVTKLQSIYGLIAQSSDLLTNIHSPPRKANDSSALLLESELRPHSVQELRILVPLAQGAMKDIGGYNVDEANDLDNFPTPVEEWLSRQWVAVFKEQLPVTFSGLRAIHSRYCDHGRNGVECVKSAAVMIGDILELHAQQLDSFKETKIDDLIYYGFDPLEQMETICSVCQEPLTTDEMPRWSVLRVGHYAIRARRCHSTSCNGVQTGAIPKNGTPYVQAKRSDLSVKPSKKTHNEWRAVVRLTKECDERLPRVVESWCIFCKAKTRLLHGRDRYVDTSPRWDIGCPPKYIERRPRCLNCQSAGRTGTARFVPVNDNLPSTCKKKLSKFEKQWKHLPRAIKSQALSTEPRNMYNPRSQQGQKEEKR